MIRCETSKFLSLSFYLTVWQVGCLPFSELTDGIDDVYFSASEQGNERAGSTEIWNWATLTTNNSFYHYKLPSWYMEGGMDFGYMWRGFTSASYPQSSPTSKEQISECTDCWISMSVKLMTRCFYGVQQLSTLKQQTCLYTLPNAHNVQTADLTLQMSLGDHLWDPFMAGPSFLYLCWNTAGV